MPPANNTLAAIDPRRNAVVHASAGTGKTWLLVSRIIRLLLAGANPGGILAITFTRKAAAEMRLRLAQRLLAMCQADDGRLDAQLREIGVEPDAAVRTRARELYEALLTAPYELRATTFHAFCQELLQRFAFEAGVPPAFELIEQTGEIEQAAWRALDADLRDNAGPSAAALGRLLDSCGGPVNVRRALATFLAKRSDWWAYTEDATDPVAGAAARLQESLAIDPAAEPAARFARDSEVRRLIGLVCAGLRKHPGRLKLMLARLEEAATAEDGAAFYGLLCAALYTDQDKPRVFEATKALENALGVGATQALLGAHAALLERLIAAREEHNRFATWQRSRDWYFLGNGLLAHFQRIKFEQNALDFADLEWLTYRLLRRGRHAEWVQYKLDQRIDHLLIDEFQDTNPTQWRLILPVLEEMTAGSGERARSAFVVGDEKQSIYRFRRADPALLREARTWLETHAQARAYEQYTSWRSSPAVIRFVNLVFQQTPGAAPDDSYALANFHVHDTHKQDLWGHAELLPLVTRDPAARSNTYFRNPLEEPRLVDEDQRHRREGDMVARKIQALGGQPVPASDGLRPLRYGDMLVLLRDRKYAASYEAALRHAGIPYVGAGRGTFLQCLEVRDLLSLLHLLIAPFDDVALASVLRSPIFAATDADLLALADIAGPTWLQRLTSRYGGDAADAPLARAARLLQRWRTLADRVPVHDLLDRIYFDAALPERYRAAAPVHLRARVAANLNRLLDLALELDSGRFPSLARFLDRLEVLTQDDNESLDGAADAGDQVRLLTIHGAKGLEAPVVFVVDSARDPAARDRGPGALIEWPLDEPRPRHFLLAPRKADADALSWELLEAETQAAEREEANLLYVALTRAKQMLFVSGCEPRPPNAAKSGAGDSARGWYGYIERRLQAAAADGTAERLGLALAPVPGEGRDTPYNLCGSIDDGVPPERAAGDGTRARPAFTVDPALTRPFAAASHRPRVVAPSYAMPADIEDAEPEELQAAELVLPVARRGVVIHRMLERLSASLADRESARRQIWREYAAATPPESLDAWWREACTVIEAPELGRLFDPGQYREARNEVTVLYRENGQVTGVIDRLVMREGRLTIIDYKTHRVGAAGMAPLVARYTPQLRLYADGLRRLWPDTPIEALLLFTATARAVAVETPYSG